MELIPINEKITIYTLAEELSMTPSMVSRAFNPNAKIAADKRKAVLEKAAEYGFSPNKFASRLSMKTVKIGILTVYKAQHVKDGLLRGFRMAFDVLRDYKIEYTVTEIEASKKSAHMCRKELFALSDCDGVILSGFGSSMCRELLCEFSEINPNIVFLQNVCENVPFLFASRHNEALAAEIAANLLAERLHFKERKNILILTGDRTSSVHRHCFDAFTEYAKKFGLTVVSDFDMKDRDDILSEYMEGDFKAIDGEIDGIYITSGNSKPLCEALKRRGSDISLVCTDVNSSVSEYIQDGTVFASICQNFEKQARTAFETLAEYLLGKEITEKIAETEVMPVLRANLELYRNK